MKIIIEQSAPLGCVDYRQVIELNMSLHDDEERERVRSILLDAFRQILLVEETEEPVGVRFGDECGDCWKVTCICQQPPDMSMLCHNCGYIANEDEFTITSELRCPECYGQCLGNLERKE